MSDSEGADLSDWTVMVKRGEKIAEVDGGSSDSSIEVVTIDGEEAVSFRCHLDEIPSHPDEVEQESGVKSSAPCEVCPRENQVVETDGGLGACCMELVKLSGGEKDVDEQQGRCEEAPIPVHGVEAHISPFNCEPDADVDDADDSDGESDFVRLEANGAEELGAVGGAPNNEPLPRVVMMERSTSSIGPSFNFFRQGDPHAHQEDNSSDRDSIAYLDDDTESSVEDDVDDRIESEQSEVGSTQAQNDVGDLSAFADIGDLPLEVGNVARNYIHRPNNRLSTLLNTTVLLAAILTMGMSLGIIMAGDLEIEEWQRAYDGQVKKTLEMDALLFKAKSTSAAFEEVLIFYSNSETTDEPVAELAMSLRQVVSDLQKCKEVNRYEPSGDCRTVVLAHIEKTVANLKLTRQAKSDGVSLKKESRLVKNNIESEVLSEEKDVIQKESNSLNETSDSTVAQADIKQLQESLLREQERALYFQQLYLQERRQRERDRENEELEDQRERALWEKEDEEEDHRLREQWEKEEAEEDRMERLKWEQEEEEEDRRDREQWEREKTQITFEECFKVISANLTGMAHNVMTLNTSRLNDFANLSLLMSNVAKLKESVVQSVKQLRKSTEAVFTESEKEHDKSNEKEELSPQQTLAKYLKGALRGLKSEVDSILNMRDNGGPESTGPNHDAKTKPDVNIEKGTKHRSSKDDEDSDGNGKWHKAFKNLFKLTSKSLRRFGREIAHTWRNVKSAWKGRKGHGRQDAGKEMPFQAFTQELVRKTCKGLRLSGMTGDLASKEVDIGSQCANNVRHVWYKAVLNNPCQALGMYSYACNIDYVMLKKDIKRLQKNLEKLRRKETTISSIHGFKQKAQRKLLGEFQDFWDTWADNDLLMSADKAWALCRLRWWAKVVDGGSLADADSCRPVKLSDLFEGLVEKDVHRVSKQMPLNKDIVGMEESLDDETEPQRISKGIADDKEENKRVITDQNHVSHFDEAKQRQQIKAGSKLLSADDGNNNFDSLLDEDNPEKAEGVESTDGGLKTYVDDISSFENLADGEELVKDGPANDTFGPVGSLFDLSADDRVDQFSESDWLLERAQLRLQLRRDKERAAWIFERAAEREKLRKQRDMEEKPDWFVKRAKLREDFRKSDHEADWLFDRAKQRREKFAEKWEHPSRNKVKTNRRPHMRKGPILFDTESPDNEFSHHKKRHNGQKWQKQWKKDKNNKHTHSHSAKKPHTNCHKGKCGHNNNNFKRGGRFKDRIKRFIRQTFSMFTNP